MKSTRVNSLNAPVMALLMLHMVTRTLQFFEWTIVLVQVLVVVMGTVLLFFIFMLKSQLTGYCCFEIQFIDLSSYIFEV